jgi:hypothetical protein
MVILLKGPNGREDNKSERTGHEDIKKSNANSKGSVGKN